MQLLDINLFTLNLHLIFLLKMAFFAWKSAL